MVKHTGILGRFSSSVLGYYPSKIESGYNHIGFVLPFSNEAEEVKAYAFVFEANRANEELYAGETFGIAVAIYDLTENEFKINHTMDFHAVNLRNQLFVQFETPFVLENGHEYVFLWRGNEEWNWDVLGNFGIGNLVFSGPPIDNYRKFHENVVDFDDPLDSEDFNEFTAEHNWCAALVYSSEPPEETITEFYVLGNNVVGLLMDTGKLIITGEGPTYNYGSTDGPFYQNEFVNEVVVEKGVTRLGNYIFRRCWSLEKIELPVTVKEIGSNAFQDTVIKNINLRWVTSVGAHAFSDCGNLTDIGRFNSNLRTLPNSCFRDSGIRKIDLSHITTIEQFAFENCENLTDIGSFNDNVILDGPVLFRNCDLREIDLSNVKNLSSYEIFRDNSNLTDIGSFNPELPSIGVGAFRDCDLREIDLSVLPNITRISESTFRNNSNLTTIGTLPSNVTSLGSFSFRFCALTEINLSNITSLGSTCFAFNYGLTNIGSFNSELTEIPVAAFRSCDLKEIDLSSITSLGDYCFFNCDLEEINVSNITSFGEGCFGYNQNLTDIGSFFPNLATLEPWVFRNCDLREVDLSNITSIGDTCFAHNENLTDIGSFNENLTELESRCFENCDLREVDLSNITSIGDTCFAHNENLTDIGSFNENLTVIQLRCFENCDLREIDLSNITELSGSFNFTNNHNLIDIGSFNENLTTTPTCCFKNCDLTEIDVSNLLNIAAESFAFNSNLTSIGSFNTDVTIGGGAFRNCNLLTLDLSMIDAIYNLSFAFNPNLTEIGTLNDQVEFSFSGGSPFMGCYSLPVIPVDLSHPTLFNEDDVLFQTDGSDKILLCYPGGKTDSYYKVPEDVTKIDFGAFGGNNHVEKIIIGDNINIFDEIHNFTASFSNLKRLYFLIAPALEWHKWDDNIMFSGGTFHSDFFVLFFRGSHIQESVDSTNTPYQHIAPRYGKDEEEWRQIAYSFKKIDGVWQRIKENYRKYSGIWKTILKTYVEGESHASGESGSFATGADIVEGQAAGSGKLFFVADYERPVHTDYYPCSFAATTDPEDDWIASVYIENQNEEVLLDAGPFSATSSGERDNREMIIECNVGDTLTISVTVDAAAAWTQSLSWGWRKIPFDEGASLNLIADLTSQSTTYTHTYTWEVPDDPGDYIVAWWQAYDGYVSGCGDVQFGERHLYGLTIRE